MLQKNSSPRCSHPTHSTLHSCLSLRQAALEKQSSTRSTPGPIYNANVNACSTSKNKCRDISFGSGARFGDSVVPEINSRRPSTPGPQSYNPNLLAASGRSSRSTRFGSATRACNADSLSGKQTPSPSEYDPESIRQGLAATRRGSASITFGKASSSDKRSRSVSCVGPMTYDPEMIRRGIMSTRRSSIQSVTFGRPSSARPSSARPSSARPSTRRGRDHQHPSPQQYDTEAIRRGVFSLSTKRRPSGVAFTTGPRTYNDAEERERARLPGPCTYQVPSSLGDQANSRYKNAARITFGSR